ncbi:MAG: chemotaxis protein CheW [Planctomycetota bacterium]
MSNVNEIELVAFSVANLKYCLEIKKILEIRRWSPVTALPHAPAEVLGVMNLRGAIIPIYDLAARFGLGNTEPSERFVVIVCAVKGKSVGLLVESVSEIISIDLDSIQPTPDVQSQATRDCIQGVISVNEEMARLINLDFVVEAYSGEAA